MTAPRQILPGATYLITRRCSERRFFLRPSPIVNAVFLYVLAIAARRFGIEVHALCVLSNHVHLVVTDPGARLPAFAQYLWSLVARAMNASLGRWESFWAPGSYSAVRLESPDDIVAKVAYVLANPVAAGLVRHAQEWPGVRTLPGQLGRCTIAAPRPATFFRANGYLPGDDHLALTVPPGFASAEEFERRVVSALAELEEARAEARPGARGVLGVAAVLAQKPSACPAPVEPRRALNPRVAARDKWKRIEALTALREFLSDYRAAWDRFRRGARDVLFPAGTYLLRVRLGVACADAV